MNAQIIQKHKKKTLGSLIKAATRVFNAFIRDRDSQDGHFTCISCQRIKSATQMHAGHYYSAGKHPSVRFDENNVHGQCVKCNTFEHGNLIPYRENLPKRIGAKALADLDQKVKVERHYGHKWDRFALIEIIEKYK